MSDPAQRRLGAILRDEEYGPKLVHLNRADERKVLDLIDQNKGREARKEIIRLDESRRIQRTVRTNARAYAKLQKADRTTQWSKYKKRVKDKDEVEFWRLYKSEVLVS